MINPVGINNSYWRKKVLRWGSFILLLLLIALYLVVLRNWLIFLPSGIIVLADSLILIFIGVLAFLLIDRSAKWQEEREALAKELARAEKEAAESTRREQTAFHISRLYHQTSNEDEVIELTLRLSQEAIGAKGASFVPLDERTHPLNPVSVGDIPDQVSVDWLQYLASPAVRKRCTSCTSMGHVTPDCSLLEGPISGALGIFCLPFSRGDHDFGVLNLYLPNTSQLHPEMQDLIKNIVGEATLALDGIRLRKRELATLHELQSVRERTDLDTILTSLLVSLNDTLEADFSQVSVWDSKPNGLPLSVHVGDMPDSARSLVDGIQRTVMSSRQPVLIGDVSGDLNASPGVRALMATPLMCRDENVMGALVVTSMRTKAFNQRKLSMLQTVTSQAALVVQNVSLMAELEYKTLIDERTRLAREIHDGLAQTLGFLKLKMAQMKIYAEQSDFERLIETIPVCHDTLADAYQEARQAIDGLRITANGDGLDGWLRQTANEFHENSGLLVHICDPVDEADLPPEVHAQLIRIVQEALNNIRKHANGEQAWVSCQEIKGDLILEVRDDGSGFDIEDIPQSSQYGLRGMRERAELIGADIQIISIPMQGTVVRVRLPLEMLGEKL